MYLALAPKSNAVYTAYGAVQQEIEHTRQEPVPLHLRNAPTRLMKELDYAKGYRYAHDEDGRVADMDCLPESLKGRSYYQPTQEGREKALAQRMEEIRRIRAGKRNGSSPRLRIFHSIRIPCETNFARGTPSCSKEMFTMGTWTALNNQPPFSAGTMLLLTDGTVMCQQSGTQRWHRLTPDANGSYKNGTSSNLASGPNAPLYFSSAVLQDGRVFVAGGEYEDGLEWELLAAQVYNPQSNFWSIAPLPAGSTTIGDAPSCMLPDGMVAGWIDLQQ